MCTYVNKHVYIYMPYSPTHTDQSSNDTITNLFLFPQTRGDDIGVPCPIEVAM